VFVLGWAAAQLILWLITRPDLAGPEWRDGVALELWLGGEALLAVLVGATAPDRRAAVRAVQVGWFLQVAHFAVLGEHYDSPLWGLGMVGQVLVAVLAAVLARTAHSVTARARRRTASSDG
jgi:hypothetical protein